MVADGSAAKVVDGSKVNGLDMVVDGSKVNGQAMVVDGRNDVM